MTRSIPPDRPPLAHSTPDRPKIALDNGWRRDERFLARIGAALDCSRIRKLDLQANDRILMDVYQHSKKRSKNTSSLAHCRRPWPANNKLRALGERIARLTSLEISLDTRNWSSTDGIRKSLRACIPSTRTLAPQRLLSLPTGWSYPSQSLVVGP